MKYRVIWHDAEDDRTGSPFTVKADSPSKAYFLAQNKIKSWGVKGFVCTDIEALLDETGRYHHPDVFLGSGSAEGSDDV